MLECRQLTKRFGRRSALDRLDLTVATGEILAVLGPSGSGKSTLLRSIAGLEDLDAGSVWWDGEDVTTKPVHQRGFGLMFQSYALFPHMTVGENVGFGLRMQGAEDVAERVGEALAWVGMAGFTDRSIEGLSGGEQQRVALARSLAPRPLMVMLDEPLGALDRMLRRRLLRETEEILRATGTTTIYVTHDHEEAGALADRIAVLREGRIVQTGTLEELAARPADPWVAEFVRDDH